MQTAELTAADYLRHGITTAQEGAADPATITGLIEASRTGALGLDVVVYPVVQSGTTTIGEHPEFAGDYVVRLRLGGYKKILDGSPQARPAWMSEPYAPIPGDEEPGCAYPIHTPEEVEAFTRAVAQQKRQLILHCKGDAAAQLWVATAERMGAEHPALLEARPVMIHAQTVRDDQRMAKLGMIASIFSVHTWFWADVHLRNFGPERDRRVSPTRSELDCGVRVTLHQNSPVTPPDMLLTLWAAVNRISRTGQSVGPRATNLGLGNVAGRRLRGRLPVRRGGLQGQVRKGLKPDLVILSADPLATALQDLRDIEVVATIKDGEVVFQA